MYMYVLWYHHAVKLLTAEPLWLVADPRTRNGLPNDVISADSLLTFRRLLKRFFLFQQSFPGRHLLILVPVNITYSVAFAAVVPLRPL